MKHRDPYSDTGKFHDPADWDVAYVEPSPIDTFMMDSEDPRLVWITVAITFHLTSIRGLSVTEIAGQMGVSAATVSRATAEFKRLANLDPAGSIQAIPRRTANTI